MAGASGSGGNGGGGGGGGGAADHASAMIEWEDGDRFSFEDSDRFEEDSLCSWTSEPESVCNNWRGWKRQSNGGTYSYSNSASKCSRSTAEGELHFHSIIEYFFNVVV